MQISSKETAAITIKNDETYTFIWWKCLRTIAMFNMALWYWSFQQFRNEVSNSSYTKHQLYLSAIYTVVCAYRSVYPRIDLERYCLFDTQISSIFLGRSAATVAEIAYSCQFALLFSQIQEIFEDKYLFLVPTTTIVIVPAITIAQVCCWRAILVNNCFWHVIEESIWGFFGLVLCTCFGSIYLANDQGGPHKNLLDILCIVGAIGSLGFFAFMATVDVPMYIEKSRKNVGNESKMASKNIVKDLWSRRVVTTSWSKVWHEEAPWLTGYFSMAVWISISLIHVSMSLES